MGGVLYGLLITLIFFAVCTIIGLFFSDIDNLQHDGFNERAAGILSFVDIVSN
jgi:hypothetical protein